MACAPVGSRRTRTFMPRRSMNDKLRRIWKQYEAYITVDAIMYAVMIGFIGLLFLFFA
jgi:hypothetical protein